MKVRLITKQNELSELCEHIDDARLASFDLEFIPERTYFPILCLIQVNVDKTAYLVDPIALPELNDLYKRVADENIKCIFHAGSQDLELIYSLSGLVPKNIFDTQIAAGFAGYGYSAGYRRLLSDILGVQIPKTESFSDWQSRPLTEAQIDYAVSDVIHLIPLYNRIVEKLNEQERLAWAEEECKAYEDESFYARDRSKDFLRIKGANTLNSKSLAVLKELWIWRDSEAQRINKPPRVLLSDNVMLELARKPPVSVDVLKNMRGIRPDQARQFGRAIISAIDKGRSLPESEWPVLPTGRAPTKSELLTGDFLYVVLKFLAGQIDLAPEHICTRDELQLLVRLYREKKLKQRADLKLMEGWRYNEAGKHLIDLLSGEPVNARVVHKNGTISLELNNKSIQVQSADFD